MEQKVRVTRVLPDGMAQVLHVRQSACSGDCHKCAGCGAAEEKLLFLAKNPIGAKPGDTVMVESETAPVLRGAAVLYVLPLILFFLGYLAGTVLPLPGAFWGCLGFLLGVAAAVVYDRRIAGKEKSVYTITEITERGGSTLD